MLYVTNRFTFVCLWSLEYNFICKKSDSDTNKLKYKYPVLVLRTGFPYV